MPLASPFMLHDYSERELFGFWDTIGDEPWFRNGRILVGLDEFTEWYREIHAQPPDVQLLSKLREDGSRFRSLETLFGSDFVEKCILDRFCDIEESRYQEIQRVRYNG